MTSNTINILIAKKRFLSNVVMSMVNLKVEMFEPWTWSQILKMLLLIYVADKGNPDKIKDSKQSSVGI